MFEDKDSNLTSVDKLGEFKLIEHVTRDFEIKSDRVLKGIGDDAAVYEVSDGQVHLVSTDLLVEGVHFDLSYVPLKHLGFKSVVVNLSDIFAMNAKPFGITVSVAMSSRFSVEALDEFYVGVKHACDSYGVELLGGDTSSSRSGLMISVTALGEAKKDDVVYRSGAKENDLICLSGDLGAAFAGLQILEREKTIFLKNPDVQPDLIGHDYVVGRQLKPEARADVLKMLNAAGVQPTSMIDVSDGLASEIMHLCKSSGTGASIFADKIILDHQTLEVAETFDLHPLTMALNGGEDYELLFTVSLDDFSVVESMADIQVIGHMTEEHLGQSLVTKTGSTIPLEAQGWDHFKK